jgi:hypothetical protein
VSGGAAYCKKLVSGRNLEPGKKMARRRAMADPRAIVACACREALSTPPQVEKRLEKSP